ncbi:uncharacterized protein LOC117182674 [Belonocnema kinseyi]|uniref:uncharacterized protein LOC117182674 n=1 Tax=Belonocnema kinseyi TaxID=2817044 RepID=UPI00143D288B|nr:uncharacterized protein LOC117182674 [Belonocnema kinseyi]
MLEFIQHMLQLKLFWVMAFVFGIYLYLKFSIFNYWKKHGVPHEKPIIPVGNILPAALGKQCIGTLIQKSYERFKSNPFHGMYMFHIPHLVINDPELIRLIIVKDFAYFHDRGLYYNNDVDPISGHLFFMPGKEWKFLRSKLTPTFTSGKIKEMFSLVEKVAEEFKKTLAASIEKSSTVEMKDLLSRYTTDTISSIAFGVDCNSFKNPDAEFRKYGEKALTINPVRLSLAFFFSNLLDILRIPLISREASRFFNTAFLDVITHRRSNRVNRKDFINLLIPLMDHGKLEDDGGIVTDEPKNVKKSVKNDQTISMSEACAQAFIFFVGGYETSSSTSTYCLHELAFNTEIQDKLREEIKEKLDVQNKISYEDVNALPYLHEVVSETLRKYPIIPFLNRVCVKDYKIPNSDFCIPKGMHVIIPVLGLQNDSNIFPDPEDFRPERFDSDQIAKRNAFTYFPFGEGPRICMGKRFGLLQVKLALIKIIQQYKFSVCDKTEMIVKPTTRNFMYSPAGDVFLKVEKVSPCCDRLPSTSVFKYSKNEKLSGPGVNMPHVDALRRAPVGDSESMSEIEERITGFFKLINEEDEILVFQYSDASLMRKREIWLKPEKESTSQEQGEVLDYESYNNIMYKREGHKLLYTVPEKICQSLVIRNHDLRGHPSIEHSVAKIRELQADHEGPFVKTARKNRYILVVIDNLTNFVVLNAVHDAKAESFVRIMKDFVLDFEAPGRIVSDRGISFPAPQANGQVERINVTLIPATQASIGHKKGRDWDLRLKAVQRNLHESVNKTSGSRPLNYSTDSIIDMTKEKLERLRSTTTSVTLIQRISNKEKAGILKEQAKFIASKLKSRNMLIDSSKRSLKAVLLHNTNKYAHVPLAHSTVLKEEYLNFEMVLKKIMYEEHQWRLYGDSKILSMILGQQSGFTKYSINPITVQLQDCNAPADRVVITISGFFSSAASHCSSILSSILQLALTATKSNTFGWIGARTSANLEHNPAAPHCTMHQHGLTDRYTHKKIESGTLWIIMLESIEHILQSKLFWCTTFVFGIYLYMKFVIFNYWKKHGVPHETPIVPTGNILPVVLGKVCIGTLVQQSYESFKSNYSFHGLYMFHVPHLIINNPDLIRLIMIKDFAHFHDRGLYYNNAVDPLSGHLFFMPGEEWKFLRSKLSPTFTSGKMKEMFPLVQKVAEDLKKALDTSLDNSSIVEVKDLLSRYTTDMIASIAFGVECNSLKNPIAEFRVYGKKAIDTNPVKMSLALFFSKMLDILRIPFIPKDASLFFSTVFKDVISYRRSNHEKRTDFLNLLIQLMDHGKVKDDEGIVTDEPKNGPKNVRNTEKISISVACAQAFVFFIAGFETSSSTSTYCLHELALNPDVQDKLRQEINDKLAGHHLSFEDIHTMPYLDKVVSETLRKYPIVPILNRVCLKDYKIPNSNFCIPKGMKIIIPVLGIQRDPKIFPDPEEFRPERFDSNEIAKRHAFSYLPFGEGPRVCIGKRFGLLQIKVALIKIISNYKLSVCDKTEIVVKPTIRNFLLTPAGDILLKMEVV